MWIVVIKCIYSQSYQGVTKRTTVKDRETLGQCFDTLLVGFEIQHQFLFVCALYPMRFGIRLLSTGFISLVQTLSTYEPSLSSILRRLNILYDTMVR